MAAPALLDGRLNQKDGAIYISFRLEMRRRPTGRFAGALTVADSTCDWTPRVPVRLYVARGDEQAASTDTRDCARALSARRAQPRVIDLGRPEYQGSRHLGSSVTGTARILDWRRR